MDNVATFAPSLVWDLLKPFPEILDHKIAGADMVWMSPPCQTFSMASGGTHWGKDRSPLTPAAVDGFMLLMVCERVADYCIENNKIFFIENPRARARWFLPAEWRQTVWYCQYGDTRAKPTDIWTNLLGWTGKQCHNGNRECHHQPAPRGSKAGTQGLEGTALRSEIPGRLFEELLNELS